MIQLDAHSVRDPLSQRITAGLSLFKQIGGQLQGDTAPAAGRVLAWSSHTETVRQPVTVAGKPVLCEGIGISQIGVAQLHALVSQPVARGILSCDGAVIRPSHAAVDPLDFGARIVHIGENLALHDLRSDSLKHLTAGGQWHTNHSSLHADEVHASPSEESITYIRMYVNGQYDHVVVSNATIDAACQADCSTSHDKGSLVGMNKGSTMTDEAFADLVEAVRLAAQHLDLEKSQNVMELVAEAKRLRAENAAVRQLSLGAAIAAELDKRALDTYLAARQPGGALTTISFGVR